MSESRRTLWWARIVCLSAFGPYVTGTARTEQIAVFASLLFILVTGWPRMIRFGGLVGADVPLFELERDAAEPLIGLHLDAAEPRW